MSLTLFGTAFVAGDATEAIALAAARPRTHARLVVTANVDHIVTLSENAAFRKAYAGAAARTLDGMPLVWLARRSGAPEARRITGHDLLAAALARCRVGEERVFLVPSSDLVGERVAAAFVAAGLAPEAVLYLTPPFGFEGDQDFSEHLAQRVRAHGTTLAIFGVGAPKTEIWVDRFGAAMGSPVTLAIGDALNVAAGLAVRPPALVQSCGLEWLFRFLHDPKRLFRRYFVRSWRFLWLAVAARRSDGLARALRRQEEAA